MKRFFFITAIALCFVAPVVARADSTSDTFLATLNVTNACAIVKNPALLDFGTSNYLYNQSSDIPAQMTFYVMCNQNIPYSVDLSTGGNPGPGFSTRNLWNGGSGGDVLIAYNLFQDPGFTTVWGSGMVGAGGSAETAVGDGNPDPFTIFGDVPVGAITTTTPAGTYQDKVVITVSF